jgi:membrane protein implicated in regulation of membrane protease activity
MIKAWIIWLIFGAVLLVAEIFTTGFFLFWFGIAAGLTAIVAALGASMYIQWAVFVVASVILVALTRPFAEKMTGGQPEGIGANRFIGLVGTVIEEIDPKKGTGMVRIKTDEWRAETENDEFIPVDERVRIEKVDGTRLIVKKCE